MRDKARNLRTAAPRLKTQSSARVRVREKTEPFYLSAEWRGLMARLIKQRGRQCQVCGREHCTIFGDHIIELKDDGAPLDPVNIQLLCGSCHTLKTNRERAKRASRSP